MHQPEFNLALVEAMLGEIGAYLVSPELFWPMDRRAPRGSPPFPRLTLGGLLLALDELSAQEPTLTAAQAAAHARLRRAWDEERSRRESAIECKASQEMSSRVNLWEAYLGELRESPGSPEDYSQQVGQRVMAARLKEVAARRSELGTLDERLHGADAALSASFLPGEFIWDARLQAVYPKPEFWFLYGSPRNRS